MRVGVGHRQGSKPMRTSWWRPALVRCVVGCVGCDVKLVMEHLAGGRALVASAWRVPVLAYACLVVLSRSRPPPPPLRAPRQIG